MRMEFVMIVEPDEVGRKRLEAVFQTEKPSFSYQITGRPEEALDILEHQKTDVLVCETSLSVLSGREFFTMAKMISPDTVRVAMTSAEHVKELEDELLKLRIENAFLKELRRLRLEDEAKMRERQESSVASEDSSN